MAKKGTKSHGKTSGHAKAGRKTSKVKDLPAGSRTARSVKGGSFTEKLGSAGNFNTAGSAGNFNTVRNRNTV